MSPVGRQQKALADGPTCEEVSGKFSRPKMDLTKASPPPQPQNVQARKIFVFGSGSDSLKEVDNGSIELTEIRSRKDNWGVEKIDEQLQKSHFYDHVVVPDDSLTKLSLKFGCTITQLKQANGIYNEQDLFAFKTLKIPVHAHSMIWDNVKSTKDMKAEQVTVHKRSHSDPNLKHITNGLSSNSERSFENVNGISTDYSFSDDEDDYYESERRHLLDAKPQSNNLNETNNAYEEYLETVDKDIQKLSDKIQSKSDNGIDVLGHSLAYMQPSINDKKDVDKLGQAGWFSYKGVLFTLCLVAVIVPLMYILYFKVFNKKR